MRPDRVASFGCRRLDDELLPWRPASSSRILILTTFDLDAYVYEAPCAGASGFLLKDAPPADLFAAIRIVAAGDALIAPSIARGLSNDEIAEHLVVSPATVRTHIGHLLAKLEARDRAQLVIAAYEGGLVGPQNG